MMKNTVQGSTSSSGNRKRSRSKDEQRQQKGGVGGRGGGAPATATTISTMKNGRKIVTLAADADAVLTKCRELKEKLKLKKRAKEQKQQQALAKKAAAGDADDKSSSSDDEDYFDWGADIDEVGVKSSKEEKKAAAKSSEIPKDIVEVEELSSTEVIEGIEAIAVNITNQVLSKKGFSMEIPSRSATNQIYVKDCKLLPLLILVGSIWTWGNLAHCIIDVLSFSLLPRDYLVGDRIVLGSKKLGRSFLKVKESRKSAITLRVMQLLHAVLMKRIHITKRDLFYTDVKLFVDQAESDGVLDDVACMIGCTRSNLHVVASDKGLVVGRIQFEEDGDYIDCTKMGVGGKAIPPYIDKIENITSDAEFILLVEKEAAYMRMAEDRFYHRYPCIIITAKGQPDVATRMFLARVTNELEIPVLGLVDR